MATAWARDRASFFYFGFGLFALAALLLGFSTTYFIPISRRTFDAPWFVHVHGLAATSWVLLLILQAAMVRQNQTRLHRRIGWVGLPIALLIWSGGVATALWGAKRDLPQMGSAATSNLAGTASGLTIFLALVLAAIALRRRPDWHKRILLLATIHLLWPAIFRWRHVLPPMPNPDVWLALVVAYAPVLIAAGRDWRVYGKVHPVWLYVAPLLVVEQSLEYYFFDRGAFRVFGQFLFDLLA